MAELRGGTTIGGYTALHSGLQQAYLAGNLTLGGNLTMNGTQIADSTGKLYYQGNDTDTRYIKNANANGYDGLSSPNSGTSNWIRTTTNGILPVNSGGASSLGTSSWPFLTIYGTTIYEGGTALSGKYLGISAQAADSAKLGGVVAANYLRSDTADTMTGAFTLNGTLTLNNNTISGVTTINGQYGVIAQSYDEWLRFNNDGSHTSGVYFGSSIVRTDGWLQVGANGSIFLVNPSGTTTITTAGSLGTHDNLTLTNTAGGIANQVNINFRTYSSAQGPQAQIAVADAGGYTGDIIFSTKLTGADTNSLVERMRIKGSGDVTITGRTTVGGTDFMLGTTDQTTRGNSGTSRALVKDNNAVLALNFSGDFTGGVRVDSDFTINKPIPGLLFNVSGRSNKSAIFWNANASSDFGLVTNVDGKDTTITYSNGDVWNYGNNDTCFKGYAKTYQRTDYATNSGAGWKRIAQTSNATARGYAKFTLMENSPGRHEIIQFIAGTAFNNVESKIIQTLGMSKYANDEWFGGLRIEYNPTDTYAIQYLSVYMMDGIVWRVMMEDNWWNDGWTLITGGPNADPMPSGYTYYIKELQAGYQNVPRNILSGTASPPSQGSSIGDIYVQY